jgi:hypothetical protein
MLDHIHSQRKLVLVERHRGDVDSGDATQGGNGIHYTVDLAK